MEHRLRIAHALSATATLGVAALAFAAVDGGLFAHAAPATSAGSKTIEIVDDYIVVHSPTTTAPAPTTTEVTEAVIEAARLAAIAPVRTAAAPLVVAAPPVATPAPTPAQAPAPAPSDDERYDDGGHNTVPDRHEQDSERDERKVEDERDSETHEQESAEDGHESEDGG